MRSKPIVLRCGAVSLAAALLLGACGGGADDEGSSWMFVQTAETAVIVDSQSIEMPVLRDLFGFTDRPNRDHVYLDAEKFVGLWSDDLVNAFNDDPPNAVLTWVEEDALNEVEIALLDAELSDDSSAISYTIQIEEGSLPSGEISRASLFIDSVTSASREYLRRQWGSEQAQPSDTNDE